MKKVLGLILTFAFLFTFVQAFDWMTNTPAANAIEPNPPIVAPDSDTNATNDPIMSVNPTEIKYADPPVDGSQPAGCIPYVDPVCVRGTVSDVRTTQEACHYKQEIAVDYNKYPNPQKYPDGLPCSIFGDQQQPGDHECPVRDGISALYARYTQYKVGTDAYVASTLATSYTTFSGYPVPAINQVFPGDSVGIPAHVRYAIAQDSGIDINTISRGNITSLGAAVGIKSGLAPYDPRTIFAYTTSNGTTTASSMTDAINKTKLVQNRNFLNKIYSGQSLPFGFVPGTVNELFREYTLSIRLSEAFGRQTSMSCYYPETISPDTQLYKVVCFTSYDSYLYQSQNKDTIRNGGSERARNLAIKTNNTANLNDPNNYGITMENHLQCFNELFDKMVQYKLDSPESGGYGYYRIKVDLKAVTCDVLGYPRWMGIPSEDRIANCTGENFYTTYNYYSVYSCDGFAQYSYANLPDNVNFSVSACVAFNCKIDGNLTIGGTSNDLQVMRNGENLKVSYPTISITDVAGSSSPPDPSIAKPENGAANWSDVTYGATGVVGGSSPYNGAEGTAKVNDAKQYFKLRSENNTPVNFLEAKTAPVTSANSNPSSAWQVQTSNGVANPNFLSGNVNFNWASAQGKSWQMFRTFRVNGEFWVPVADDTTGATTMKWQHESKYCGDIKSNKITVVRSVNEIK